ncbi:hypothetical protein ALC56_03020 [Trachymyrmex septentrionalis]|uniref:DDE-1 domain-containing protein n=1 Tax=Trachymyrmex septentrionalis TaxID=34720 RepID=A0A151JZP8_9HYME|nr:hypothetical protein ALC56_03020 [Trachymyrmex septentrionalis]
MVNNESCLRHIALYPISQPISLILILDWPRQHTCALHSAPLTRQYKKRDPPRGTAVSSQKSVVSSQKSEVSSQKSVVSSQKSEISSQQSETTTVQNSGKIIAEKDSKAVCKVTSTEKGILISTCYIILSVQHFIKFSYSTEDNPLLLIYDNHESYISLDVFELAKANGVHILTLPPRSIHRMQPLDVGLYSPFQKFYNTAIDSWMMSHPRKTE